MRSGAFLSVQFCCSTASHLSYGHEYVSLRSIPDSLLFYDPADRSDTHRDEMQALRERLEDAETECDQMRGILDGFLQTCRDNGIVESDTRERVVQEELGSVSQAVLRLKRDCFFSLGIGMKMSARIPADTLVQELWEEGGDVAPISKLAEYIVEKAE